MQARSTGALKSTLPAAVLALAALSAATPASAQLAGLYVGTTEQGQSVEIKITQDEGGLYYFGGATVYWEATCKTSGPGRQVAWGIGVSAPLGSPNTEYTFASNALYENYKFRFLGGTRIKGTFIGRTPEFVDPNASSKKVQLCDSGALSFVADYTGPAPLAGGVASDAAGGSSIPAKGSAVQLR